MEIIALIICITLLIFIITICITIYKCEIISVKTELNNTISLLNEEKSLRLSAIEILKNKEQECVRLNNLLIHSLEKTTKYSVDANLKM